eukprot:scaffold272067_cov28-Tisochrysis_lutea.AAC.2
MTLVLCADQILSAAGQRRHRPTSIMRSASIMAAPFHNATYPLAVPIESTSASSHQDKAQIESPSSWTTGSSRSCTPTMGFQHRTLPSWQPETRSGAAASPRRNTILRIPHARGSSDLIVPFQ